MLNLNRLSETLRETDPILRSGKVSRMTGLVIEGTGPQMAVGNLCEIQPTDGSPPIKAEVVGFREGAILLMPLTKPKGISPGCTILSRGGGATVKVSHELLGRILDGLGNPLDGGLPIAEGKNQPIYGEPVNPLKRAPIDTPIDLGVRAINSLLTCGKGQRVAVMAGTGVGKSVLMGMMARNTQADVNVIALIGERGKEVRDFIEKNLGEEGMKRSIIVAATSDQPPLVRLRGAYIATAIAEYFRAEGKDVLLMMDSVTRFAMAQREIGLAVGEPPTTKGYTPSVFSLLPELLERAGRGEEGSGSITGLYTVLVEGDDLADPIADSVRAILDGHIILDRAIAAKNHYPAIDIQNSVSRAMIDVTSPDHMERANRLKEVMAVYREAEDLINIGAYVKGSNPRIDLAIKMDEPLRNFLRQGIMEKSDLTSSLEGLNRLAALAG